MKYRLLILSFFCLFLIVPSVLNLYAKVEDMNLEKGEEPVELEADELIYDRGTQTYEAHGQVEVNRGDLSLKADHARWSMETKDLMAWGHVLLREGEDVIECQRLELNTETRAGKIYEARLFLKEQNFHITGREADKLGENHYRLQEGSLTTCDAKQPPWKFTVKEIEIKETATGGWGFAKGPVFYIKDVPVLYFPWGAFPVRQERQSGFLLPQVGYSSKYGPQVKNGFYWAIEKNMDATFYFDWLGDRGFKEGLEYRYALTQDTQGHANFYFIDDKSARHTQNEREWMQQINPVLIDDPTFNSQTIHRNRYAFFIEHEQKLPGDFYLKADINRVSDHQYLQDFDEDISDTASMDSWSSRQMRSVLFGGKNWDAFSLLSQTTVYDDLTKESNDGTTQKLPQVSFYAYPQSFFNIPLFFDLSSSYSNFWREKGVGVQRGDIFPRITWPTRLFNILKFESDIGVRGTYYNPSYRYFHSNNILLPDPVTGILEPVDSTDYYPELQYHKSKWRNTLAAGMQLSTEFYRVYEGEAVAKISDLFKVSKWMHTIEPMVRYDYGPRVNQDEIPVFDEIDRISYTNQITYGITQRLVGKPEKENLQSGPFEYGKLVISQSCSLGDPYERDINVIDGNPFEFILGKKRHLSTIRSELWWNFNPYLSAHFDTEIDSHQWSFDRFNFIIKAKNRRDDVFQVQYRNTRGGFQEIISDPRVGLSYLFNNTRGSVREINLDARIKTINPLYLYGAYRYNLLEHWNVANIFGGEYQSQCWAVGFYVEDKNRSPDGTRKGEMKFNIYLILLNIGSGGKQPYFMNL